MKHITCLLLFCLSLLQSIAQTPVQITTTFNHDANNYSSIPVIIHGNKAFYKVNYDQLWVSDGSSGGSFLLKDFNMSGYSIGNFIELGSQVLFTAQLNGNGTNVELWKTDGTVAGTQLVKVIGQDYNNYFEIPYQVVNNQVFFKINYDLLWVSDGTTSGTQLLKDFNMSNWSIGNFVNLNNTLIFTAQLNGTGTNVELWKSDGTVGGTQLIKATGHDFNNYFTIPYQIVNNKIFYKFNYDLLWVCDGTIAGTYLLKDFNMSNWSIGNFTALNSQLIFTAQLNGTGTNMELWKSDGTVSGTQLIKATGHDFNNYYTIPYQIINNKIFYKFNYDLLWVCDGTTAGTFLLKDFNMSNWSIGNFTELNNQLIFTAQLNGNGTNMELWKSDGTVSGTTLIKATGHDFNNYFTIPFALVNNKIFYKLNYDLLWFTDGSTAGTSLLKDFNMSNWSIGNFIPYNNQLYFTGQLNGDGSNLELWKSDGTVSGTQMVKVITQNSNNYSTIPYAIANGKLFLKINYDNLWYSDGSTAGTTLVKDFNMSNWSIDNFVTLPTTLLLTADFNGTGSTLNLWAITLPTGLETTSTPISLTAYPNPTTGQLSVQFPQGQIPNHYIVFNLNGQPVSEGIFQEATPIQLEPGLAQGIYMLQFLGAETYKPIRFTLLR